MLTLIAILLLIVLGLVLLVVEVIFIPGTTLVGILGVGFAVVGVWLGFAQFGSETGLWILVGTAIAGAGTLFWSIRNRSWEKFSLDKSISSRVNEEEVMIPVGSRGFTTSALRPYGKAEFDGQSFEVRSQGQHLPEGTPVRVAQLQGRTIYVEPLTNYQ